MGKNRIIIISKQIITLKDFKREVASVKSFIQDTQLKKINLFFKPDSHTISLLYGALLSGIHVNITLENTDTVYDDFLNYLENPQSLTEDTHLKFYKEDSDLAISFGNENITYAELKKIIQCVRKNFGRREVFYADKCEKLSSLCMGVIIPIYLEYLLIFNDNLTETCKLYKPSVFILEKRKLKKLYNFIFHFSHQQKLKEIFYNFFKDWDNGILYIFINRNFLFRKHKNLRSIIVDEHNDLKGLWLDFESLGIDLFSKKIIMRRE